MKNLLQKIPAIKLTPKVYRLLPESFGVYIYLKSEKPIYVGKAINLRKRVASYFNLDLETKTKKMIGEAESISFIKVGSELEALLLEAKLIKLYLPKYNIISKDDKHPLYIQITKDKFPIIKTVRKSDADKVPNIATYGPFPSSTNVRSVLKMIRKIFPYSDHKLGKKPCLYSQIGLCNPCPNEIVHSTKYVVLRKEYLSNIRHVKSLLDGKISKVKENLEKEMKLASKNESFEDAANLRNKIQKLEYITSPKVSVDSYLENPNLYEDVRQKELKELKSILKSRKLNIENLNRIECFDVAHLQGINATASLVTLMSGTPDKAFYRHFKIYQKKGGDDYESMREVARRRAKHLKDWGRPDLIIVDGGKGQLGVFLNEFEKELIPVIGLAKRFETLVIPEKYLNATRFTEYKLPQGKALNLVQRIRNEAHRFAQAYHHKLFAASLFERKS